MISTVGYYFWGWTERNVIVAPTVCYFEKSALDINILPTRISKYEMEQSITSLL